MACNRHQNPKSTTSIPVDTASHHSEELPRANHSLVSIQYIAKCQTSRVHLLCVNLAPKIDRC